MTPTPPSVLPTPEAAERELLRELQRFTQRLHWSATALQALTVLIALAAVVLSLLVATYSGSEDGWFTPERIKLLAFLSAVCASVYTGFRIRAKAADLRTAYRLLAAELFRYRIGLITAAELIDVYRRAEAMIGQVEVEGLGNLSDQKKREQNHEGNGDPSVERED